MDERAAALARLFADVREGVYIGTVASDVTSTIVANPHLKLIFGFGRETSEQDVRPFDLERFVDPQARVALVERLTTDGSVADYQLRLRRADHTPVWVEMTGRADAPAADGSVRVEALIRDVSERKKLGDQARDAYRQLLQAEKMAALGQSLSGIAHELNNPLAAILSWAERLSAEMAGDAHLRQGLETILSESDRAARLVGLLLTFARKRQTMRAAVDINQIVRETLALRAHEQRASNINVIEGLAVGLPQLIADGEQIQQILLNLIINAEQAMVSANGRGTLVVRTWHDVKQESVILEISDDGPGIPEHLHTKVFDPFFTTKAVGQGIGLGLAVAYAIVMEHGGRIRLQSPLPSGASFHVELPVTGGTRPPAAASTPQWVTETVTVASILLVEDETALATAVSDALRDAGYLVQRASDGQEALDLVRRQAFDLVICDLKMPRLDGKAFYRAVVARSSDLARRIIFVTGDVGSSEAESFLQESGCRCLAKPFRLADMLRAVREGVG